MRYTVYPYPGGQIHQMMVMLEYAISEHSKYIGPVSHMWCLYSFYSIS